MSGHACTTCGGDYAACVAGPQCCAWCHRVGMRSHQSPPPVDVSWVTTVGTPPVRPWRGDPLAVAAFILGALFGMSIVMCLGLALLSGAG